MKGATVKGRLSVIGELLGAADDFAERARAQEVLRDRSRPGTGVFHQHAHSATLWRLAEGRLRSRASDLQLELELHDDRARLRASRGAVRR